MDGETREMKSCTTSDPGREPVLVSFNFREIMGVGMEAFGELVEVSSKAEREKVVYERPWLSNLVSISLK